jgi:hypothetical protein
MADRARRVAAGTVRTVAVAASAGLSAWLVGRAVAGLAGNRNEPWILGRAAGVTSYLLLVGLVSLGLLLSHPWRTHLSRPSTATRIRMHVGLAVFTLAFVVLHVVVLATDSYAGVGWRGALLPMGATFRPLALTLGVIATYAGLLAGASASIAGRVSARVWWPLHKLAALTLVLVWLHGVLAGSDHGVLMVMYVGTGAAVALLAASRYAARTHGDRIAELAMTGRHRQ